jgi:IS1 family transposase
MACVPANTRSNSTTNSWLFPPQTREVQFDEKWSFVAKKEKNYDPDRDGDALAGECWDYIALDPEHRLVVSVVVGKHSSDHVRLLVEDFHRRTQGRLMNLMTSDENPAYAEAIHEVYGQEVQPRRTGKRGRPRKPYKRVPKGLKYATVHKTRQKGRVVKVEPRVVFGTRRAVVAALALSLVSTAVNTVFVERSNGSDRHRNSRKVRKTYRFSKDWEVHEAVTYFTLYQANFCCPVRTLREWDGAAERWQQRTPAMAAGLVDHIWSIEEWLSYPSVQRK